MKKTSYIKKALLKVTFITAVLLIASCSNSQKPKDIKDVAEEHNYAKFDNKKMQLPLSKKHPQIATIQMLKLGNSYTAWLA